jgi:Pentapeptide repeats (8 copies)
VRFGKTNFFRAILNGVNLEGANLCEDDLRYIDLRHAKLLGANVDNANLMGAILDGTSFESIDLSQAVDLDKVQHNSPSEISRGILQSSKGKYLNHSCAVVVLAIGKLHRRNTMILI